MIYHRMGQEGEWCNSCERWYSPEMVSSLLFLLPLSACLDLFLPSSSSTSTSVGDLKEQKKGGRCPFSDHSLPVLSSGRGGGRIPAFI